MEPLFPKCENRPAHCGFYFVDVKSECHQEKYTLSWFNLGEVTAIVDFYKRLIEHGIKDKDIGIISTYSAQTRDIKDEIHKRQLRCPKVGTVEVFQGDQRFVILMSPVRSTTKVDKPYKLGLGFVDDPKRINVAISRARSLLVVFGDSVTLCSSRDWKKLVDMAKIDRTFIREGLK